MTKHYATPSGEYIGAFDGVEQPDGAVLVPAPESADMHWDGTEWRRKPLTLDQALAALKAKRDEAMCAGIEVAGVHIQTDDLSQQRLTAAALAAQLDPESTVRWKTASGAFVVLSAAQVIAIAMAVRSHVQACFDREAELTDAIMAADNPESTEIDFSAIGAMAENL